MPPAVPAILPRQPGETLYAFRNRRSIALTGQTLYERRVTSGARRGLTLTESRGKQPAAPGVSEYAQRREQTLSRYGLTPSQLYYQRVDLELSQAGFTPASTKLSQTALRRIWPRLKWINANASPDARFQPSDFEQAVTAEQEGLLERRFVIDHVNMRYESMYQWLIHTDKTTGRAYHEEAEDNEVGLRAAWWYYH